MRSPALVFRFFLLTGALALAACSGNGDEAPPARPAMVVQAKAGGEGISAFAGEVRARHEPVLSFRIGGKIARRDVDVGERVRKGQVLAELDASDVALQLEASRAQLASAEADLALAASELERYRSLLDRQLVSRSLYDARVSAHEAAQARVRQAKAQAAVSGNQAAYATLRAPADGVIAQRQAEAGQVVAAGQAVFVLAEDGEREVAISLPEQVAADFPPGRELAVELWSVPGQRFPGRVREVAPAADPQARTFAARVAFDPGKTRVELGQSARVYARGATGGAVVIPLSALAARDKAPAVWVVDPATSEVTLRDVVTGPFGETEVPVVSGLEAGEWVVAAGVHLLQAGQKVRPVDRENRAVDLSPAAKN